LEYFFDPELNIAVVMLNVFNEELLDTSEGEKIQKPL
jgi:hypothetical protein